MNEQVLEQKLKRQIEAAGGLCLKWVSPGFTGVPDRICLLPGGKIFFAEVKRPDGKGQLSIRQKRVKAQLESLGFEVKVVDYDL